MQIDGIDYVELEDAARQTKYDRRYLRRLAQSGKIEARQIGRTWVVTLESIARYKDAKPQRKPHKSPSPRKKQTDGD